MTLSCPRLPGFGRRRRRLGTVMLYSHATTALADPSLRTENVPSMPETIKLDASRVPERLRKWIPLAQRWGHSDDGMRSEVVDGATREELDELLTLLDADKSDWDALHAWLAGAEAKAPPTEEYVAFTCLTMTLDLAEVRRKHEDHPDAFRTPPPAPSAWTDAIIHEQYADRPKLRTICDTIIDAAKAFRSLGNRGDPAEAVREVVIFAGKDLIEIATRRRSFARIEPTAEGKVILHLRLDGRLPVGRLKPSQSGAMSLQISIASLDELDGEVESWLHQAYKENR
jgi:hypothetical protein